MQIEDSSFHQHDIEQLSSYASQVNSPYLHSPSLEVVNQLNSEGFPALLAQGLLVKSDWGFWHCCLEGGTIEFDLDWRKISGHPDLPSTRQEFEMQLIHPDDVGFVREMLSKCLTGETPTCEIIYRLRTLKQQNLVVRERLKVCQWDQNLRPLQMMGSQEIFHLRKEVDVTDNLLARIRAQVACHGRFDSMLRSVCEDVRAFCDADRVVVYQLFAGEKNIVASIANTSPSLSEHIPINSFPLSEEDMKFFLEGGMIFIDDVATARIHPLHMDYCQKLQIKACGIVPILEYPVRETESPFQPRLWGLLTVHICYDSPTQKGKKTPHISPSLPINQTEHKKLKDSHITLSNFPRSVVSTDIQTSYKWYPQQIKTLKQVCSLIGIALQKKHLTQHRENAIATLQLTQVREKELQTHLEQLQRELEQYKQKLIQTEQFALLGHLIQELVSEIHNPIAFLYSTLTPVSQNAEDLIRLLELYQHHNRLSPDLIAANHLPNLDPDFLKTELLKQLWSMRAGSDRLQTTTKALQEFTTPPHGKVCKYDLHTGINSCLTILQHRLKANNQRPGIQIIKDFAELPQVECYPSEINQVFIHLLHNAIDAIEDRVQSDYSFAPTIRIRTAIHRSHLSLVPSPSSDRQSVKQKITVTIADNGNGILPHIQRRIFEPFFTTKANTQIRGLGLTICKHIIDKHIGKIRCTSQFGQGTEFLIELNSTIR